MNYYEHHLGDYMRDAGHLSMLEDGCYRRLIEQYYIRERPLPAELDKCCKLARATSKDERDAVFEVLSEFFVLMEDGYHQKRCDAELARYQGKKAKAKASAEARWASKKESERTADAPQAEVRSKSERSADALPPHSGGTSERTTNGMLSRLQSPDSNLKTPESDTDISSGSDTSQGPLARPESEPDSESTGAEADGDHSSEYDEDAPEPDEPPAFTAIRKTYPKRRGSQRWPEAIKHYRARLKEGFTAEQMREGAERYAKCIRAEGKERTQYVFQAATFLGTAKEFLKPWPLPKTAAEIRQDQNLEASQQWLAGQDLTDA